MVDNNENLLENNFTVTKYYYTLKDTEIKQIENNIIKENLLWVIQKADGLLFVD